MLLSTAQMAGVHNVKEKNVDSQRITQHTKLLRDIMQEHLK